MAAPANGAIRCAQEQQDESHDQHDRADNPQDVNCRDRTNDQQNDAENNHSVPVRLCS
jgi:hypothetical protein